MQLYATLCDSIQAQLKEVKVKFMMLLRPPGFDGKLQQVVIELGELGRKLEANGGVSEKEEKIEKRNQFTREEEEKGEKMDGLMGGGTGEVDRKTAMMGGEEGLIKKNKMMGKNKEEGLLVTSWTEECIRKQCNKTKVNLNFAILF